MKFACKKNEWDALKNEKYSMEPAYHSSVQACVLTNMIPSLKFLDFEQN